MQPGMEWVIECLENCPLMRNALNVDDLLAVVSQAEKVVQKSGRIHLYWF